MVSCMSQGKPLEEDLSPEIAGTKRVSLVSVADEIV